MMQLKENQKKSDQDKQNSSALNTEEILSLLSKTSQDFKKESEITENISYLFNKKTPKDLPLVSQSNIWDLEECQVQTCTLTM